MRNPKGFRRHECCPEEWRMIPDITGSFELDAMIMKNPNRDMASKIVDHLTGDGAYTKRTAYNRSPLD